MRKEKDFRAYLVQVELTGSKDGVWQFAGTKTKGTIFEYQVKDSNFSPALKWSFQVRVPSEMAHGNYIDVRPTDHPQKAHWAGLDRKSVTFTETTQPNYFNFVYAKLFLSDVTGEKNKVGVRKGERSSLPGFMQDFKIRLKRTVVETDANDRNSQVAIVKLDDHAGMIRLFLAMKAWVIYNDYAMPA